MPIASVRITIAEKLRSRLSDAHGVAKIGRAVQISNRRFRLRTR